MKIVYDSKNKELPCDQLCNLFPLVGWSKGETNAEHLANFNIGFKNSTLVISAWDNEQLIGAVRVISDSVFRSIIYDLVVHPAYQNLGIGSELVMRCIAHFPNSEWLVQTTKEISSYYKRLDFKVNDDTFLSIPCKSFTM